MNIVLFGPPGSGKGTQSDYLVHKYNFYKIATGDLLRTEIKNNSELGRSIKDVVESGGFPEEGIVNKLVRDRILENGAGAGFVFDGYPRTIAQAEALHSSLQDANLELDMVIELQVDHEILLKRITGRFSCTKCGANYHEETSPPKQAGKCDNCGGTEFNRRSDDDESILRKRLELYHKQTEVLVDYYDKKGLLKSINGNRTVNEVSNDIDSLIDTRAKKRVSEGR